MTRCYDAPWGLSVKLLTAFALTVCGVVAVLLWRLAVDVGPYRLVLTGVLVVLVGASAVFAVRGYTLEGRRLRVHRLLWDTELSLSGLRSIEHDPAAMSRSIRVFGNEGMFGVTGWFWNRTLRLYRAFVTDPKLAVVLRLEDRVVVVSPHPPGRFVAQVRETCRLDG